MFESLLGYFEEFFENFRVADALDILLMAIFVYSALVWFKETASRRVLIGVSVLVVVYFLARAFDLYLTSLVFHTGFAVLLIVLIVVFQEDLRRMFESVAAWSSLRGFREAAASSDEVDTLVELAWALSSDRTGALIVLKGAEPLGRHIDGEINVGGAISKEILWSIFDASSPGHDGAVVIDRDRIVSFAAQLPISKNQTELGGRGTRHSAALGLSELSDALVVVVSEETGKVSIAQTGRLRPVASAAALKGRLEVFFAAKFPRSASSRWRNYLARHWRLKTIAVGMSIAAWFVLAYKPSVIQRTFVVPIEYRNLQSNLLLDETAPAEARVTLSGSEQNFRFLEPGALKVSLNLADLSTGNQEVLVTENALRLPTNLEVYRIEPKAIYLFLREQPRPSNGRKTAPAAANGRTDSPGS